MNKDSEGFNVPEKCSGFSLVIVIIVVALLGLVSATVLLLSSADARMSGEYREIRQAYYDAFSGVQLVRASIDNELVAGTLTLTNPVETVNYTAPSDFNFDPVTDLTRLGTKMNYLYTVTGHMNNAVCVLEAVVRRKNLLSNIGIFGDLHLKGQSNTEIYSYRSGENPNPSTSDSTGEAVVGSNTEIDAASLAVLDGIIVGGQDADGNPPDASTGDYTYEELNEPIDPDPLGIIGGVYQDYMDFYKVSGNNDNAAVSAINGTRLQVNGQDEITIPSGNYYLTDIDIKGDVTIDASSSDPVVFWIQGEMKVWPSAQIISLSKTPDLHLYTDTVSENKGIDYQPTQPDGEDTYVCVYAPYCQVKMLPNNNFYGWNWADESILQPNIEYWIDLDSLEDLWANSVELLSLKEVRM